MSCFDQFNFNPLDEVDARITFFVLEEQVVNKCFEDYKQASPEKISSSKTALESSLVSWKGHEKCLTKFRAVMTHLLELFVAGDPETLKYVSGKMEEIKGSLLTKFATEMGEIQVVISEYAKEIKQYLQNEQVSAAVLLFEAKIKEYFLDWHKEKESFKEKLIHLHSNEVSDEFLGKQWASALLWLTMAQYYDWTKVTGRRPSRDSEEDKEDETKETEAMTEFESHLNEIFLLGEPSSQDDDEEPSGQVDTVTAQDEVDGKSESNKDPVLSVTKNTAYILNNAGKASIQKKITLIFTMFLVRPGRVIWLINNKRNMATKDLDALAKTSWSFFHAKPHSLTAFEEVVEYAVCVGCNEKIDILDQIEKLKSIIKQVINFFASYAYVGQKIVEQIFNWAYDEVCKQITNSYTKGQETQGYEKFVELIFKTFSEWEKYSKKDQGSQTLEDCKDLFEAAATKVATNKIMSKIFNKQPPKKEKLIWMLRQLGSIKLLQTYLECISAPVDGYGCQ